LIRHDSEKYKMAKNNKIMIYLKRITKKLNKYIEDKNIKNEKELEISILKNVISNDISKKLKVIKKNLIY